MGVGRVTIHGHVQALIANAYLENLEPGASRGLELTPEARTVLNLDIHEDAEFAAAIGIGSLPFAGRIAAGGPIEAIEQCERLDFDEIVRTKSDTYLLEVQGDSMIDAHIQSGDLVVIEKGRPPQSGDIVVAILQDEEATLKYFKPQPDASILLVPANDAYDSIRTTEVEIRGVVTGVIRQY
jgi:repressor LexA